MTLFTKALAVAAEVVAERRRQHEKWGEQNHPDGTGPGVYVLERTDINLDMRTGSELANIFKAKCQRNAAGNDTYRDIFLEEVFEAMAESDPVSLRTELVQVAAVAVAWIEAIDRRAA